MSNYQKHIVQNLEHNGYYLKSVSKNEIVIGYETAVFPLRFPSWKAVANWLNEVSVC